ncbi:hypothetical protein [Oleiharenicola sp. Vm1]|uniref:hypothetical protein n=1 Tax=Oleiharenicola sp. Vm1 TaxID=3398393 RepID=UPI0039F627CC
MRFFIVRLLRVAVPTVIAFSMLSSSLGLAADTGERPGAVVSPTNARAVQKARKEKSRADLLSDADIAASLQRANPERGDAAQLKYKEARARLAAALLSSEPASADVLALGRAVRADEKQPPNARIEIARLVELNRRKVMKFSGKADWLREREAMARRLIREFPDQAQVYDELLAVAQLSARARALELAREIAVSPASPRAKQAAQALQARLAAEQQFAVALDGVPGAAPLAAKVKGKVALFYTWRPEDSRSIELAKALNGTAPKDALVFGINLSIDAAAATRSAAENSLPGEQLYAARGFDSPAVRKLGWAEEELLIAVTKNGVVLDLSREKDRAAALAKLN